MEREGRSFKRDMGEWEMEGSNMPNRMSTLLLNGLTANFDDVFVRLVQRRHKTHFKTLPKGIQSNVQLRI